MMALPRLRGTGRPPLDLLAGVGLLVLVGCAALRSEREPRGLTFLAQQYLRRGNAAWAAGNEANARFLIGRAVELAPGSKETLALWESHWPLDSLPPAARAALSESRERAAAEAAREARARVEPSAPATAGKDGAGAAATAGSAGEPFQLKSVPVDVPPPVDVAELRSRLERARAARDEAELRRAGEELLRARPTYLPDLHRALSAWVGARVDPPGTEAWIRDILGSLEFGDPSYLTGKPDDVEDARYLRAYRGRFLDLLGWAAFLRGEMAQAEAALRSAEIEINLRGRGDVSHLRHLAAFYERRGNIAKAESYALAAAARDESGASETRALAARLWTRRHGGTAGLEARLAAEAQRVQREERSAAIANRLYQPLPMFAGARSDGGVVTDESLRGRVTVLVLWRSGCEDCLRLLRDLSAGPLGSGGSRGAAGGTAEVIALDVGEERGAAGAPPGAGKVAQSPGRGLPAALPGVVTADPERPAAFAQALGTGRLPLTLVIEPAGFIQYRHTGYPLEPNEREGWLERLGWQVESLSSLTSRRPATRR